MIFKTDVEEQDTKEIVNSEYITWDFFKNTTIMVTGATGLIGEQIVKALLCANETLNTNIKILALVRNKKKTQKKYKNFKTNNLHYIIQDIVNPIKIKNKVDFIIHTANSTSSKSFVETPVETIDTIISGTKNILEFAKSKQIKSLVYLSSMEVYGKIDIERKEPLKESDYGYIDIMAVRSSYSEGKRLAENMCIAYSQEYGVPVKIARLSQTIGSGVDYNDNRVFAQFARNIVENKDIELLTEGKTIRSYCYITDAVSGIFAMLERGKNGECYNVANPNTTCSIREMAEMLCNKYKGSKLKIKVDDKCFPPDTKMYLDTTKMYLDTTWIAKVSLEEMFDKLIANFMSRKILLKKEKKISLLQQLFSVKNKDEFKIIRVLGLKFQHKITNTFEKYKNLPIEQNKIVLSNYLGKGYGCNPKYIVQEIIKQNLPYKIIWLIDRKYKKNFSKDFPQNIKLINYKSKKSLKELITAKLWIDNQRKLYYIERGLRKRTNQYYIQTWHGSLGIKKLEKDVLLYNDTVNKNWINKSKLDSKMADFYISNSKFESNIATNGLWFNNEIKEYGHPKNDIFFYPKDKLIDIKNSVYNNLNINKNKKICLYIPTFRDTYYENTYNIKSQHIKQLLHKNTNENWEFVIRLHPFMLKHKNIIKPYMIDATFYPDIQELLVCADVLISDYSSCMFDFMLSRKPCFIYATDIEEYNNERGFYYPLETTPFPIATNNEELINNIENFDYEKYKIKVEEFLKEKGCMEDGHASERVVNLIKEIINKD